MKIEPTPIDMEGRTCVEIFDADNVLVERSYGPSTTEQQKAHDRGECHFLCGICYHEAMVSIGLE